MSADLDNAFDGYDITHGAFFVEGKNLVVHKKWQQDKEGTEKPFSISVRGEAFSKEDLVCVIGQQQRVQKFNFVLTSDDDTKTEWELDKQTQDIEILAAGTSKESNPKLRLINLVNERLEVKPPTARLFLVPEDRELKTSEQWILDCKVPRATLMALQEDLVHQKAKNLSIRIDWVAALINDKNTPVGYPKTWSLFKISNNSTPEPLRGHVAFIGWEASETSMAEAA